MKRKQLSHALACATALLASAASHAAPVRTLFLGADGNLGAVMNDIIGKDARFDLANSTTFDATTGTPSLSYLEQFDSVLYWTNNYPQNPTNYGNLLADYADAGGLVVQATFVGQQVSTEGRLGGGAYSPFSGTRDAYIGACLGSHDANSPIMAGVTTLCSPYFRGDWASLNPGATLVASWSDGAPFVGINAKQDVIDISLFPNVTTYGNATGDYRQLFANALAYDAESATVPEPSDMALIGLGLLGMGAILRRRKH